VQEATLRAYAERAGGEIVRFFRIAETASKSDERTTFRELVRYAKQHAPTLDGLLFYKVDRAARNLYDYVELERLESEYGVPFISISQPTESTPAGRMMRRTLANMASFPLFPQNRASSSRWTCGRGSPGGSPKVGSLPPPPTATGTSASTAGEW